jgi:uncharacterized protein YybS (DUF2232 family)
MIRRTFNLIASIAGFVLGSIYLFSDGISVTANVIGASGSIAGFASIIGIVMIISAMALFMVTLHNVDNTEMDLEKLVRRTKTYSTPQVLPEISTEHLAPIKVAKEEKKHKHAKK